MAEHLGSRCPDLSHALEAALQTDRFYISALGSQRTQAPIAVLEQLDADGV
jgi:hypothetical protein